MHVYEVRPRKDKRGIDLICDADYSDSYARVCGGCVGEPVDQRAIKKSRQTDITDPD